MPDESRPSGQIGAHPSDIVTAVLGVADQRRTELGRALDVLDLGGGTGGVAVPLAGAGHHVTVVDPSPNALAALDRRVREADLTKRVRAIQGDGDSLAAVVEGRHIDLVCCHGALEFVDDPASTLRAIATVLAPDGTLSLLVAGRLAVVLAKAIAGEFAQARSALVDPSGRWGDHDPLPRRFDLDALAELLVEAGFTIEKVRGNDIIGHLVPARLIETDADRAAVAELDDVLVSGPGREFLRTLASGLHVIARRA